VRFIEPHFRKCLAVIRLAKTDGRDRLEAAWERALAFNTRSCSSLHSILKNRLDRTPRTRAMDEPAITHPNIRGADFVH
jgi:transposase